MTFALLTIEDLRVAAAALAEDQAPLTEERALDILAYVISGTEKSWATLEAEGAELQTSPAAAMLLEEDLSQAPAEDPSFEDAVEHHSSIPLPKTPQGRPIADLIMSSYSGRYPSGVPTALMQPDIPMKIRHEAFLDQEIPISACKTPTLHALEEALKARTFERRHTFHSVHVSDLSPRQITGDTMPLFFDLGTWCQRQRSNGIGDLDFDAVPVLAFIEDAWSETLKALDRALAGRFMRWQFAVSDHMDHDGPQPEQPLTVFFVQNEDRFQEVVRRYMPFTYQELSVPQDNGAAA